MMLLRVIFLHLALVVAPLSTDSFAAVDVPDPAPCERFAPWVTPGPRITRFRLAADLGRMGLDTHRVSNKVSKITSRHLVPVGGELLLSPVIR